MGYTTFLDSLMNKVTWGRTAWAPPATVYVGLSTTQPAADGTGVTEPAGGAYARQAVPNDNTGFTPSADQPAAGQEQTNAAVIQFPKATVAWGTVTYFVIYDAAVAGNLLAFGALAVAQVVGVGVKPNFAPGDLELAIQ